MPDSIKPYLPIAFSVVTITVSLVTQWAILGVRIADAEARLDRQGSSITDIKTQLASQSADYAALSAKLDSINDNVSYIRSRVDRNLQ